MRIMIIESDWSFEIRATRYLESRAHLVVHETPFGLLKHACSWRPELIILGAEFVSEDLLKELRQLDPSPAVLITEHMCRFDRAWQAWQIGGDELLMKPIFHHQELQQAVTAALEHAALATTEAQLPAAVSA
jgi:DNA-binding response OmpR family regulator